MTRSQLLIGATALGVIAAAAGPASANYSLGTVTNNSDQPASVASVLPPGRSVTPSGLGRNGLDMGIVIPKVGVLSIYENGQSCPGYSWAAFLTLNNQKWGFGYEGNGVINITINADYSVTIGGTGTPGGNGKVFPGGC